MRTAVLFVAAFFVCGFVLPPGAAAQAKGEPQKDPYRQQMEELRGRLKSAPSAEERKSINEQMRKLAEQRRAANPPKELSPAEKEARRQKMEESLKKDPYRWEMYQLQQQMRSAKTEAEREALRKKMSEMRARRAAEAEAKLTPEQKAARAERQRQMELIRAETKPLQDKLRDAKTPQEREAIYTQIREIHKKHRGR